MIEYLNLALKGKNDWWRFLLAVVVIFFFWQIVGSGPTFLLILWTMIDGNPATTINQDGTFSGIPVTISFVAFLLASWAFLLGIFIALRFIHGRSLLSLITPRKSMDWKRFVKGFLVWTLLVATVAIIESWLYPGRYRWTLNLHTFIPFLFLALFLIPIQTTAEELFFRSYLLQGFGLRIRNIWILSAISGIFFMIPHFLNPEAKLNYFLMGIYYFSIGAGMAYITLKDGQLELALGLHAANNLFTAIFANSVITVMPTPSLFTVMEMDVIFSVISSLIIILVFVALFAGPWRKVNSSPDWPNRAVDPD